MNKYFIEDDKKNFWCEDNGFGYWSKYESSLEHRLEGRIAILLTYIMMKITRVKCKIKTIKQ